MTINFEITKAERFANSESKGMLQVAESHLSAEAAPGSALSQRPRQRAPVAAPGVGAGGKCGAQPPPGPKHWADGRRSTVGDHLKNI